MAPSPDAANRIDVHLLVKLQCLMALVGKKMISLQNTYGYSYRNLDNHHDEE